METTTPHSYQLASTWIELVGLDQQAAFPTYIKLANIAASYLIIQRDPQNEITVPPEKSAIDRNIGLLEVENKSAIETLQRESKHFKIAYSYRQ